jgi:triacylglycerol lipase
LHFPGKTLGGLFMSMLLDISASGNARNALFLARACDLAYFGEPEGPAKFRSELGLDARLISADNTQVYVAENDQVIVVAFRGSEAPTTLDGLKDWLLTNANNYLILPEGQSGTEFAAAGVGARFHRGFLEALAMIWEDLFKAVTRALETKERPLWVTGHSLGGALALLAAWRFNRNFLPVNEIVTFGAPMIGNDTSAKAFEQEFAGKIFRYVDLEDMVPHLPSVSLLANAYTHCLNEVPLSAAQAAAAAGLETLRQSVGSAAEGVMDVAMIDQVWGLVKTRIASHMIANYQSRVEAKCKDLD